MIAARGTLKWACHGSTPGTTVTTQPKVTVCQKCGVHTKTGQRTCCARGGSWHKKCGDPGVSKFAHTWGEGIQACEGRT